MDKRKQEIDLRHIVWPMFLQAYSVVTRAIDAGVLKAGVLSIDWYDLLLTLERSPDQRLKLNELADRVLFSRSGLTRLVDRVEAAGYLRRERSVEDRRVTYAVLTPEGAAALGQAWPHYRALIDEHFGKHMTDEEAVVLQAFFARLIPPAISEPVALGIRRNTST
jgi:DNA-binding MarR family transcriptional regulator